MPLLVRVVAVGAGVVGRGRIVTSHTLRMGEAVSLAEVVACLLDPIYALAGAASSRQCLYNRVWIVGDDIQQHQGGAVGFAVASFPMPERGCRKSKSGRELFLRHPYTGSQGFHVNGTGVVNAGGG